MVSLVTTPPRGRVGVGKSDTVLVSNISSSFVSEIHISWTDIPVINISFYHDVCSNIKTLQRVQNISRQLTVKSNEGYRFDEIYLINGSRVTYYFECFYANVSFYLFEDKWKYFEFISTGYVNKQAQMLTTSNLTLNHDGLYFIGLRSSISTTLHYTVTRDILEYDIAYLSPITCASHLSTCTCSITIDNYTDGQDICVFASLLEVDDAFIILNYVTVSYRLRKKMVVACATQTVLVLWTLINCCYSECIRKYVIIYWCFCPLNVFINFCCTLYLYDVYNYYNYILL